MQLKSFKELNAEQQFAYKMGWFASREKVQGAQYCFDHKIAWSDGGDCWGAGVDGIDVCRIGSGRIILPVDEAGGKTDE